MRQRQLGIRNQWRKESPGAWKGNSVRTAPLKQHWPKRLLIIHLPAEVPEFCCLLSFPVFKVENILVFWLTKKKNHVEKTASGILIWQTWTDREAWHPMPSSSAGFQVPALSLQVGSPCLRTTFLWNTIPPASKPEYNIYTKIQWCESLIKSSLEALRGTGFCFSWAFFKDGVLSYANIAQANLMLMLLS